MQLDQIMEYIGFGASFIVFISFLMSSILKLRWINLVGSFIFVIYALYIQSYPTAVMNLGIVGINIYYLVRMKKHQEIYSTCEVEMNDKFLQRFMMFNGQDIQKYNEEFSPAGLDSDRAFFVYCDMTVAGLLLVKDNGDGSLRVDLDYTTPQFRDFRVGRYLYHRLSQLGFKSVSVSTDNEYHIEYITKMGFKKQDGVYVKEL